MRPCLLTIQSVLLTIVLVLYEVHSFRWLGINSTLVDKSNERDLRRYLCSSSPTSSRNRLLDKEQKKICRRKTRLMKYVVTAAELARNECLRLAKYERWDCTGILEAPKFSKDLRVGTRQAAFLHALSSAALVFAVTRSCAEDKACDCGKQPSRSLLEKYAKAAQSENPGQARTYRYEGCHDNIHAGLKFSKEFLDRREKRLKKPASRKILNLHNYDLGRKAVRENLNATCRCPSFGITPCRVELCTQLLVVPFSKISEEIFDRYKQARLATFSKKSAVLKTKRNGNNERRARRVKSGEMAYLYGSRDFCLPDPEEPNKKPGTRGRVCAQRLKFNMRNLKKFNPDLPDRFDVCNDLCCGRGHRIVNDTKKMNCRCRFSASRWKLICTKCSVQAALSICM